MTTMPYHHLYSDLGFKVLGLGFFDTSLADRMV